MEWILNVTIYRICHIISLQLQIECTWMRETNIDWIFQGPACAVLLINLMFLFRIMWVSYWWIYDDNQIKISISLCSCVPKKQSEQIKRIFFCSKLSNQNYLFSGSNYKVAISKHSWNASISQGIESIAGLNTIVGYYISSSASWSERRRW